MYAFFVAIDKLIKENEIVYLPAGCSPKNENDCYFIFLFDTYLPKEYFPKKDSMNKKIALCLISFFIGKSAIVQSCHIAVNSPVIVSLANGHIGISDMTVAVPGYQTVVLADNGVWTHPDLFNLLYTFLSESNLLTDSLEGKSWFFPLSLCFTLNNHILNIHAMTFGYSILRTVENINLVLSGPTQPDPNAMITITINGQVMTVALGTAIHIPHTFASTLIL